MAFLNSGQIYAKVEQHHLRDVISKLTSLIPDHVSPKCVTQADFEEKPKTKFLLINGLENEDNELAGRQGFPPPPEDNSKD